MRVTAVRPIESRDGTLVKDEVMRNFVVDPIQPSKVQKRPSCIRTDLYTPAGQGFGSFVFGDYIYVWTDQNDPTYPAIYDYVPDYWGVGNGAGGGSGGYNIYWQNNNQYVEVPDDIFEELDVGDTITISGVSPSGYNGSCLVVVDKKTAAQMGVGKGNSILITNLSNPGEVIKGGVAKKLRKCSTRPAFPYSPPDGYGQNATAYINPASPGLTVTASSVTGSWTPCGQGLWGTITTTTTSTLKSNGVTVGTGYKTRVAWYSNNPALGGSNTSNVYTQSNYFTSATSSSYRIETPTTTPVIAGGRQCGGVIVSSSGGWVATDVSITLSNSRYQKIAIYEANKAAYDAMCCP